MLDPSSDPVAKTSDPVEAGAVDADVGDPDLLDAVRLNLIPGIGPRLQESLEAAFASPAAILRATLAELQQVDGIGPKLAAAIVEHRSAETALREIERCRQTNTRLVRKGTPEYPRMLAEICDPPRVLYCRGRLEPRDEVAVAIVGSRRCSVYGRQQAERFAAALARAGATVISGLARGIDAAAHRGALEAGGRTIAVAATGLSKVYPPEHKELAAQIAEQGGVVSEACLDQEPIAGLFPQRNRIISGMSLGVIIIEATRTSGALHTARHALEQGREVFAVPGRIDSLTSEGCHDLIRDGVPLVRGVDDVLQALGPLISPVERSPTDTLHTPRELSLSEQERAILNLVTVDPRLIDEVVRDSALEPSRVLATLTVLEMKRLLRRLPGGYLIRAAY
jgi:DNA processing protein